MPLRLPTSTTASIRHLFLRHARNFHPEPRAFQTSPHAAHRAFYRWTAQAIGTPFLVAYLCELIANRGESDGSSSWKLDVSQMGEALLTEPAKIVRGQPWGVTAAIRDVWGWLEEGEVWRGVKELVY